MILTPVTSSNIQAIGYDAAKSELHVQFRGDDLVHIYSGVSKLLYDELMAAKSIGSHFHVHVRNGGLTFRTKKLTGAPSDVSYANAPVSLAEVRATKQENADLWSVRDMLVAALRDIDAGLQYDGAVLCLREITKDKSGSGYRTTYWQANTGGLHSSLGLLARVAQLMGERA